MALALIEVEGVTYEWDGDIRRAESNVIQAATGMPGMQAILVASDINHPKCSDALAGILWVLKTRAGEKVDIRNLDFPLLAFAKALAAGMEDIYGQLLGAKQDPADPNVAGGSVPTDPTPDSSPQTSTDSPTNTWQEPPITSTSSQASGLD